MIIRIVKNDYGYNFGFNIKDNNGSNMDVSDATSITLSIGRKGESSNLCSVTLTNVTDGTDGKVQGSFAENALGTTGFYDGQIVIEYETGSRTVQDCSVQILEELV